MARWIIGEHFKRDGQPKRKFKSVAEANKFLRRTSQTHVFKPYECSFYGSVHLAHR